MPAEVAARAGLGPAAAPLGARVLVVALVVVAALGYWATESWLLSGDTGLPLDDSWIHLTFARSVAEGRGLAYDDPRWVTGSTAPLWTALLSLVFLLPGSPVAWAKVLGIALGAAGVELTGRLARELGLGSRGQLLAGVLVAATPWLVWSSLSAMEIPLFVVLSLAGILLHLRERRDPRRPPLALPVLALALLARPEGWLLLALALADRLVVGPPAGDGTPDRPSPWRSVLGGLALAALAAGPAVAFYTWVGGSPFPGTLAVKTSGLSRLLPDPRYLSAVVGILFPAQPWTTLAALGGAVVLLRRWLRSEGAPSLLPAMWLVALPLAYSLLSPPGPGLVAGNFGRYFFPLFPVVVVLGLLVLDPLLEDLAGAGGWRRRARLAALAVLLAPTLVGLVRGAPHYARTVANVEDSDVKMARWLAERVDPAAVLAVNDIGAMGYLLPNPLVDLAGIVDPEIRGDIATAQAAGRPWEEGVLTFLERLRPDYLVVFPTWFPRLTAEGSPFHRLLMLEIPDNITMGGDRLLVLETPWTRYPLEHQPGDSDPPPPVPDRSSQQP